MKYGLLQLSKYRWVVIEKTATHSGEVKYETFKIVSKPMPWPDAKIAVKAWIQGIFSSND